MHNDALHTPRGLAKRSSRAPKELHVYYLRHPYLMFTSYCSIYQAALDPFSTTAFVSSSVVCSILSR